MDAATSPFKWHPALHSELNALPLTRESNAIIHSCSMFINEILIAEWSEPVTATVKTDYKHGA